MTAENVPYAPLDGDKYTYKFKALWERQEEAEYTNYQVKVYLENEDYTYDDGEGGRPNNPVIEYSEKGAGGKNAYVIQANTKVELDSEVGPGWDKTWEYDHDKSDLVIEEGKDVLKVYYRRILNFYVYHSSDKTVQKFTRNNTELKSGGKFDLWSQTKDDTLYGGYYTAYEGASAAFRTNPESLTYNSSGIAEDTGGTEYDGTNVVWQWADGCEDSGREMKPENGKVYYIKEVPVGYLRNYYHITYVVATGKLTGVYLISAIDDLNYAGVKIAVAKETDDKSKTPTVVKSLTFKGTDEDGNPHVTKLTPESVFGDGEGGKGYGVKGGRLMYAAVNEIITEGAGTYLVLPYWETKDGIETHGIAVSEITVERDAPTKDEIKCIDEIL